MTPPKREQIDKPTAGGAASVDESEAAESKAAAAEEKAAEKKVAQKEKPEKAVAAPTEKAAEKPEKAEEETDSDDKPAKRPRRGAAEVAAGAKRRPKRRAPEGAVSVRAQARYVRCAPRKARLVIDHIRGKSVEDARALLAHTPRAASRDVLKLLNSAVANAEHNHDLLATELRIARAVVDEGPTIKRFRPRALGRATQIRKRTSHMTITLERTE